MLDIGCGTGLATDLLLRSALGARVAEVDLVDTSAVMLAKAQARRQQWGKPGEAIEGLVTSLAGRKPYNLIITCSVLHHVPDLPEFLRAVAGLQDGLDQALFIHLQDPNGDFFDDPHLAERSALVSSSKPPDWLARLTPSRVLGRLMREMKSEQGQDYLSKANRELVKNGVVTNPLSVDEIFAITDIHVRDGGISIQRMKAWLPDYELAAHRSYGFFGVLRSHLQPRFQDQEDQWVREAALNGGHVAAAWRRR